MAYASGAGLNTTKKCLDGTRGEILQEIVDWIHDPDVNAPRIFWLHGQAGRGKSAIAHTIALWFKDVGGLGSCFCFARDRQAECREEKMFTTISRDLADHDPAFRRTLASVFTNNSSLMATPNIIQQWEKFCPGTIVSVVDWGNRKYSCGYWCIGREWTRAIAESHIVGVRIPTNSQTPFQLPPPHTKRDIHLFIFVQLKDLEDIGEREVSQIALKADGLFEWESLACEYIRQDTTGKSVKECFSNAIVCVSREGKSLVDNMYHTTLGSVVSKRPTALVCFCSMMQQVLYTVEPLPINGLDAMHWHFSHKDSNFNVVIVLCF